MDIIVGTAGHIDHGKTSLIKALTGVDADRLPEEKQRGITIDIGFAEMQLDDIRIGFVDVPGHERFVKNMLAGASGIDLVMLVVAADEGVMPQTREHFDICRLLQIKNGLIVLTKTDLADAETVELARLEVEGLVRGSFLEGSEIIEVSSRRGAGIEELKAALQRSSMRVKRTENRFAARLSIDRSFSIKGFGVVVTGTLASGEISEGDEMELMPAGRKVRVRGVQTYGHTVTSARAGQRTAVNLGGISQAEIVRGMSIAAPGSLLVTQVIDAFIDVLDDSPRALRSRQRVRVHLGTSEVLARISVLSEGKTIEPGSSGAVQVRFESPISAAHGDRFVIRSYSPQRTIAGGRVLDPSAHRHRRSELAAALKDLSDLSNDPSIVETFIRMSDRRGVRAADLRALTGFLPRVMDDMIAKAEAGGEIVNTGGVLIARSIFDALKAAALKAVEEHHRVDKLSRGLQRETLREQVFAGAPAEVFRAVTAELESAGSISIEHDVIKTAAYETKFTPAEDGARESLRKAYFESGLDVPKLDDALSESARANGIDAKAVRKIFQQFIDAGELTAVSAEFYFPTAVLKGLEEKMRGLATNSKDRTIDVPKFKEVAGVSRKYAIPLLEYFDRTQVTRRVADKRLIL